MIKTALLNFADKLSDATGFAAIRELVPEPKKPGDVVLEIVGYSQMDSYSCGAVVAAMVTRTFDSTLRFEDIYSATNPDPDFGTPTKRLVAALRKFGVGVENRRSLTFQQLCKRIRDGYPVITTVQNPDSDCLHWVVIFGYNWRNREIMLTTNGIPLLNRNRFPKVEFEEIWQPYGFGLICWGE